MVHEIAQILTYFTPVHGPLAGKSKSCYHSSLMQLLLTPACMLKGLCDRFVRMFVVVAVVGTKITRSADTGAAAKLSITAKKPTWLCLKSTKLAISDNMWGIMYEWLSIALSLYSVRVLCDCLGVKRSRSWLSVVTAVFGGNLSILPTSCHSNNPHARHCFGGRGGRLGIQRFLPTPVAV